VGGQRWEDENVTMYGTLSTLRTLGVFVVTPEYAKNLAPGSKGLRLRRSWGRRFLLRLTACLCAGLLAVAARATAQGVTLTAQETALHARVDVELIERALANLVENSLKFTPTGGRITLQARQADGWLHLGVSDSGAGIAPADQPHLFDRFYQARHSAAPATGEGGKGLGLAIVKRIAELHGGTVGIDSREGTGTTVTLKLPASQPVLQ